MEEKEYAFVAYADYLEIPLEKAMQLAKYVRTQMKKSLIYWLEHPEDWRRD